jgi:hypothetical protein
LFRNLQPGPVRLKSDHRHFRSAKARNSGTEYTNCTRTQHHYAVAWPEPGVLNYGIVCDTAGFGQACLFKRQIVREPVKASGGYGNEFCHRTVHSIPKALSRRIKIVKANA